MLPIVTTQDQGVLLIEHHPSTQERAIYGGCGGLVVAFAGLGVLSALEQALRGGAFPVEAVLGGMLMMAIVFVLARGVFTRGAVRVSQEAVERFQETLGVARTQRQPCRGASAVVLKAWRGNRRVNVWVTVESEDGPVEILIWSDADEARALGAVLAAFLGVPLSETGDWAGL